MPIITAEAARIVAAEMKHGIMCIDPSNMPPRIATDTSATIAACHHLSRIAQIRTKGM